MNSIKSNRITKRDLKDELTILYKIVGLLMNELGYVLDIKEDSKEMTMKLIKKKLGNKESKNGDK